MARSKGWGAFLNDVAIACNDPVELNRALISSGFAYDVKDRIEQVKIVNALLPQIRDLRRIGSAAADICHVATGMVDGYFETGLHEWDLAAAELIAREAGATVSTRPWHGLNLTVAAGPHLFAALNAQILSDLPRFHRFTLKPSSVAQYAVCTAKACA